MTFRKKLAGFADLSRRCWSSVVLIMVMFLFTYVVPQFADCSTIWMRSCRRSPCSCWTIGLNAQKYARVCSWLGLAVHRFLLWSWKNTDRGAERIDRVILRRCRCWAISG